MSRIIPLNPSPAEIVEVMKHRLEYIFDRNNWFGNITGPDIMDVKTAVMDNLEPCFDALYQMSYFEADQHSKEMEPCPVYST